MEPQVADIIGIVNRIAPLDFAEEWDNPGLQIGDPNRSVSRIMISLDAGVEAVNEAVNKQCQLLITHHPLFFRPIKKLDLSRSLGSLVKTAVKHDLSVFSLHTNYDVAEGGINDLLAAALQLQSIAPLQIGGADEFVKLTVFVPLGHEEKILQALFRFSGVIGNYSDCSFRTNGTGSFKPLTGSNPFIGKIGRREYIEETRIEVLVRKEETRNAVKALMKAHPYEEPAYDLYPLLNRGKEWGLGRAGELAEGISLEGFGKKVKELLSLPGIRMVGDGKREIHKVAVCGGSGASLIRDAQRCGADVLVTGDIKYHDAKEAQMSEVALIDIGHFAEAVMIKGVATALMRELEKRKYMVEVLLCDTERDPFHFL